MATLTSKRSLSKIPTANWRQSLRRMDWFNLGVWTLLLLYLLPVAFMIVTALMTTEQLMDPQSPLYPARTIRFVYQGQSDVVYNVPTALGVKQWALVKVFPKTVEFVDPQNPRAGLIQWQGNWHALQAVYVFSPTWQNFLVLAQALSLPRMMGVSFFMVGVTEAGILFSSILVAYGFARFPLPGGNLLFYVLIATILIPEKITYIPTYFFYAIDLHWVGTLYPLILPYMFGSAVYIFLLRQNFKGLPIDLEEAAQIDGAGPLRRLFSVVLPQSWGVLVTISILHFFYIWNETRQASIYLAGAPQLMPVSFGVQVYQSRVPIQNVIEASTLVVMALPVVLLFLTQRLFMQGIVITGAEHAN